MFQCTLIEDWDTRIKLTCSDKGHSAAQQASTYTTGPSTLKLKSSLTLSTLNRIQIALFLNPKHNILTPRVLDGRIPATNSSELERRKVPERVSSKTKCPPEQHPWKNETPQQMKEKKSGVGHRDREFVHNHSVSTLFHMKKKKKTTTKWASFRV